MKKCGSLNHIYRLVWSDVLRSWVAVAETARGRGKGKNSKRKLIAAALSLAGIIGMLPPALAGPNSVAATALPTGYQVSTGAATVSTSGATMTVQETTQRAAINWQTFSIGSGASVNFVQPNSSAVILNRVVGTEMAVIDGALHSNGQVFILDSEGVLFTKNASVTTGGLLASTLNISDTDFMAGRSVFTSNGNRSSVINQGTLNADNAYVALLGNQVQNQGIISARMGSAILASGDQISLNFNGNSLVNVVVSKGTLDALVSNQQAIYADGGLVILTAKGSDALLAAAVNNSGEIQAQTIANRNGKILLLGNEGNVNVSGTLDVSAPNGGNGGQIETSAAQVTIANSAKITSAAAMGLAGSWLIDPNDFTIAASGGSITGAALNTALASNNVTISTTSGNASCTGVSCGTGVSGTGNINVNDTTNPVTWSSHTLTLSAYNNININATMNASSTAGLALLYGQGALASGNQSNYFVNAPVNIASTGSFSTKLGSNGSVVNYTIITSLGAEGDSSSAPTPMSLQGVAAALSGNYVLGANIDASATSTWNGNTGFTSIGAIGAGYTGIFDGLGHTVSNLTTSGSNAGLFGANYGTIRNVSISGTLVGGGLVGANYGTVSYSHSSATVAGDNAGGLVSNNAATGIIANSTASGTIIAGASTSGGLVGTNEGLIKNSSSSVTMTEGQYTDGGLVGSNSGTISNSASTATMTGGAQYVGGLVGINEGTITGCTFSGNVNGGIDTGGLTGFNGDYASSIYNAAYVISNSSVSGTVTGSVYVGGVTGVNAGQINSNSFSTATVSGGTNNFVGGLAGANTGVVSDTYTSGSVTGGNLVGGLIGANYAAGSVTSSHSTATVNVSTGSVAGGLAGANYGSILNSYATGNVAGANNIGGLVGGNLNAGTITNSYASGSITQSGGDDFGGLAGENAGTITNSYATGNLNGTYYGGGLVGYSRSSSLITGSHATGRVTGSSYVGGLVGSNYGAITNSYSTGAVQATTIVGGLVGYNYGGALSNSFYNVDQVSINGGHMLTQGGLYNSQYNDWFSHAQTLNIANYSATLAPGSGGYYNVSSQQGLNDMLGFVENNAENNFRLTGSISLTSGYFIPYYSGNFDGNGYTLSNLTLNQPNYMLGMFGLLQNPSTVITNLGVANVNIHGGAFVGGLVGFGYGGQTISKSYSSGTITSDGYVVGGLVGGLYGGTISNSYSTVSATSTANDVGGLLGYGSITITNSYASGAVSGSSSTGALVGSGTDVVTNSFYNKTVNPTLTGVNGVVDAAGQVVGLTAAQMQTSANFTSATTANGSVNPAWDFSGTWTMYEGHSAPLLTALLTPLTIGANATVVYSGQPVSTANEVTYSVTPNQSELFGTLAVNGTGTNAGSYAISAGGLWSDQTGYLITFVAGNLTVAPLPVTISTVSGASRSYDGSANVASNLLQITNLIGSDAVTLSGNGTLAGSAAGNEAFTGTGSLTLDNPNYTLTDATLSGLVNIVGTAPDTSSGLLLNAIAAATLSSPTSPGSQPGPGNTSKPAPVNNPGTQFSATFGVDTPLSIVSAPNDTEPTQVVSLSEARALILAPASDGAGGNSSGGTSDNSQDVRVPVSRNSLAEMVNGGVKLPTGVEQQLFVVKN